MSWKALSPPATDPVSVSEAKRWLRVDHNDEDTAIERLIKAATQRVEAETGLALIARDAKFVSDDWPRTNDPRQIFLPGGPVLGVNSVGIRDSATGEVDLDPQTYGVDYDSQPARIIRNTGWPQVFAQQAIYIRARIGIGETSQDVPAPLRQAVLALAASGYESRDQAPATEALPLSVQGWIAPFRRLKL